MLTENRGLSSTWLTHSTDENQSNSNQIQTHLDIYEHCILVRHQQTGRDKGPLRKQPQENHTSDICAGTHNRRTCCTATSSPKHPSFHRLESNRSMESVGMEGGVFIYKSWFWGKRCKVLVDGNKEWPVKCTLNRKFAIVLVKQLSELGRETSIFSERFQNVIWNKIVKIPLNDFSEKKPSINKEGNVTFKESKGEQLLGVSLDKDFVFMPSHCHWKVSGPYLYFLLLDEKHNRQNFIPI